MPKSRSKVKRCCSGVATVQVLRGDFGLTIPDVPSVANVTDDVELALHFVARADG